MVSGQKGKPYPQNWEHAHSNVLMAYRLYFQGHELDPTFPAPVPPKEIIVPAAKPKALGGNHHDNNNNNAFYLSVPPDGEDKDDAAMDLGEMEPPEERRQVLQEVRVHLDLLKEFEGFLPDKVLNQRKRELFAALPSAPPPMVSRHKMRREEQQQLPAGTPNKKTRGQQETEPEIRV
jgi:hypothetical protein